MLGVALKTLASICLAILILQGIAFVRSDFLSVLVFQNKDFGLVSWQHYHSYSEIVEVLLTLNDTCSEVMDVFAIGESVNYRTIYCVRLTNESETKLKPEVFFVGCHHGNEQITSELTLFFVTYVATNYRLNKTIAEFVNNCEIYVVVALNVDRLDSFDESGWRSYDYRRNVRGVDLNRNYAYGWVNKSGGGFEPFSEPETCAIRDFVVKHNFTYALSFHSGAEMILYPWDHNRTKTPDDAKFVEVAKGLSKVTGGTPYRQGSSLYIANGTWDDWMYGEQKVIAMTIEIYGNEPIGGGTGGFYFNPRVEYIEINLKRWLPAFFYIINRAVNELQNEKS